MIAYDPYIDQQEMTQRNVKPVDLDTLLRTSDFVTIHTPLTPETHKMIGEEALRKMKPTAWLINTARGGVVDTVALAAALREKRLAGAGLDVLPQEPPPKDDESMSLPNVIFTPHSAFYSEGSLEELQAKGRATRGRGVARQGAFKHRQPGCAETVQLPITFKVTYVTGISRRHEP